MKRPGRNNSKRTIGTRQFGQWRSSSRVRLTAKEQNVSVLVDTAPTSSSKNLAKGNVARLKESKTRSTLSLRLLSKKNQTLVDSNSLGI